MPYGLKDIELEKLSKVFAANERIERVVLYGSRAKGNYKPFSDVDITLEGAELTHTDLSRLSLAIDDLLLPYQFDISIFHTLKNEALIDHIRRMGITIYERESEWKEYKLGEIASFVTEKVSVQDVKLEDYISTENMLPDKGGITIASNKPQEGSATKYFNDTILISNIRPYLKKIWYADKVGGCSNDVLCFKAKDELVFSKYLYFLLSQDTFFDYVMLGSKGCKMPRGDKSHIMNWEISIPPLPTQRRIAAILSSLDDKIDLLHRENATLEQMAETLFKQWFVVEAKEEWEERPLSSIAAFLNGLACQKYPPKNGINKLPVLKIRELSSGIGNDSDWATTEVGDEYIVHAGDVIFAWSASLMVKIWDGEDCILNQHLFKVTSEKYPKWFYYFWCKHHLNEFISIAQSHATTMGHIKRGDLDTAMVLVPSDEELLSMTAQMEGLLRKMENNNEQINTLIQTRDGLLPRLMGGEVKL